MTEIHGARLISSMETASRFSEAPVWHRGQLFWIDCFNASIHRLDPVSGICAVLAVHLSSRPLGLVASEDGLVVVDNLGLLLVDLVSLRVSRVLSFGEEIGAPNDGKVDRAGRLWFGAALAKEPNRSHGLVRIERDLSLKVVDSGFRSSNGPAFSIDGRTMYFADTSNRIIYAYLLTASGEIYSRSIFARIPEALGVPDGMTVDGEDALWCALYGGSRILRFRSDGSVLDVIPLPAAQVTSVAFGGYDLGTLYATTASVEWPRGDDRTPPASSRPSLLFAINVKQAGVPETPFAGACATHK